MQLTMQVAVKHPVSLLASSLGLQSASIMTSSSEPASIWLLAAATIINMAAIISKHDQFQYGHRIKILKWRSR